MLSAAVHSSAVWPSAGLWAVPSWILTPTPAEPAGDVHSAQTTRSWFLRASSWFCCRGASERAEEELGKMVDGAQRWHLECDVLPFPGASGGFPQVVIQDRRCHRFWRDDEEAKKLFLCCGHRPC